MRNHFEHLQPEHVYHVFSRANGNERLFRSRTNYIFFLDKFKQHIHPIANTYSYCLLPNHFHFLLRIKPTADLSVHFQWVKKRKLESPELLPDFVMERFANWLNAYAKAFNKMYDRKGALFMDYLRRVGIRDNLQFFSTVFYIHKNPVHHAYCKEMAHWEWSSFHNYLNQKASFFDYETPLKWFGGLEQFVEFHQKPIHLKQAVVLE